jgi:hypothetical protein
MIKVEKARVQARVTVRLASGGATALVSAASRRFPTWPPRGLNTIW